MCGRYTAIADLREVVTAMGVDEVIASIGEPRYNIAPTQEVSAVIESAGVRQLDLFTWGLVLPWSKLAPSNLINARVESVTQKPSFREAIRYRRCLIPATGWYEWQSTVLSARKKQPFYFHSNSSNILAFAGIYVINEKAEKSFAIITQPANEVVIAIHDRMPLILDSSGFSDWLDPDQKDGDLAVVQARATKLPQLVGYAVSTEVNSARAQGTQLILPSTPEPTQPELFN
ncbi:MAG: SOS response-associated peptidase [Actinobacteria bacterium]|nr:SOS response-associated peptidase [Actinomycetota bacterium]